MTFLQEKSFVEDFLKEKLLSLGMWVFSTIVDGFAFEESLLVWLFLRKISSLMTFHLEKSVVDDFSSIVDEFSLKKLIVNDFSSGKFYRWWLFLHRWWIFLKKVYFGWLYLRKISSLITFHWEEIFVEDFSFIVDGFSLNKVYCWLLFHRKISLLMTFH